MGERIGGRKKGSRNVVHESIKAAYADLMNDNIDKLQSDIDKLDPYQRLNFFLNLSEYIVPKLARTELAGDKDQPLKIIKVVRE